jgi:diguanylate cyclase (GGDEF)-like protein
MDEATITPAGTPADTHALVRLGADALADLLDAGPDLVLVLDAQRNLTYANRCAREALGGRDRIEALLAPAGLRRFDEEVWPAVLDGAADWQGAVAVASERRVQPATMNVTARRDDAGALDRVVIVVRDGGALADAQARVRFAEAHDRLTSLPNRTMLQEHVGRALARYQRFGNPMTLIVIDLDVKFVHDNFGIDAADALLVTAAQRMAAVVRAEDLVARAGDSTFVALIDGTSNVEVLRGIAARFELTLRQPFAVPAGIVVVTPSIGIAPATRSSDTFESLLAFADAAMHRARVRGGGTELASS